MDKGKTYEELDDIEKSLVQSKELADNSVITIEDKDGKVHSWMSYKEYLLWKEISKKHEEFVTNCILWGKCPADTRTEAEK